MFGPRRLQLVLASGLQKLAKVFGGEAGVARDLSHRERIYGIMARNRHDPLAVGHHDVLPLPSDVKSYFLARTNGIEVIDARQARHQPSRPPLRVCRYRGAIHRGRPNTR